MFSNMFFVEHSAFLHTVSKHFMGVCACIHTCGYVFMLAPIWTMIFNKRKLLEAPAFIF